MTWPRAAFGPDQILWNINDAVLKNNQLGAGYFKIPRFGGKNRVSGFGFGVSGCCRAL